MTRLTLGGVACLRGDRLLFEGLSLDLGPGDAAVVTGRNGAGKSSLLRIAGGLLRPAAGAVSMAGRIALADERIALDDALPLRAALGFWARIDGGQANLDLFGLAALAEVPVRLLSTGQRRRAALSRVAAAGAGIWLLDEPEAGLDAAGVGLLEDAVARHRAGGGIVMIAAHHVPAVRGAVRVLL